MLKVLAAVYLLNFLGFGPQLVPFDSMVACKAAKGKIVSRLMRHEGGGSTYLEKMKARREARLICVNSK